MEFRKEGSNTFITAKAYEVADLWIEYDKNKSKRYSCVNNHEEFFKTKKEYGGTDFHGSEKETRETLINNNFVLEDFFTNKWCGKLRDDLSFLNAKSKKRKRNLSEHDGDFDFDRLWDVKLFNSTRTEPFDNRVIVDVSFDISCAFSAEDIRNYGKLCYHVTNFIEEHGYVCDINLVLETNNLFHGKEFGMGNSNLTKIQIKSSSEYQDNITICKYFTDWFYRRCIFNMWTHFGMENKMQMTSGLGYPKQNLQTKGERGYIYLTPNLKNQLEGKMDFTAIKTAIENAIGDPK